MALYSQLVALLTLLSNLISMLTAAFKVAPLALATYTEHELNDINTEILKVESRGDPADRELLGGLYVKQASARKLDALVRSLATSTVSGQASPNA